jgi:inosine triphosphate pyrophosphatase
MTLYFITGNRGKLAEVQSILENVEALDIDLPEIQSLDAQEIIKAKLEEAQKHYTGEFIVEDTSLYFDNLNGLPGPLIKWFLATIGNAGLWQIAQSFGDTQAEAKTMIGYSNAQQEISFFEGTIRGAIVNPRGEGFGWDPIFMPEGHERTFGEMTLAEKNVLSMRKMAVEKLKKHLEGNSITNS